MDTPKIALAPNFALLGVPSNSIITPSIATCSDASNPKIAGPMMSFTFATACNTPLPK